jgi:cell wall-associated NlpC family hydrolase
VRGAIVAAVGAVVLVGPGVPVASATPEPVPGVMDPESLPSVERTDPGEALAELFAEIFTDGDFGEGYFTDGDFVDGVFEEGDAEWVQEGGREPAQLPKRKLDTAVSFALAHVGDPYVLGGNGPHRWDCSGLIQQAYGHAGVRLPRIAADQYRATARIPRSALRRGDLVFWTDNGRGSGVHHAAIYLGDSRYVEAPRPGKKVRISNFKHYNPNLYGRVR